MRALGVIRVSQVDGRSGLSFASPAIQRQRIEEAVKRDGGKLLEVFEELDVSGTLPLSKRNGLLTAVEAVESGRAGAIYVGYFDRLARSLRTQHEVCERVEAVGGSVVAVDVGKVGGGSAASKLSANVVVQLAS
jgi:DNA invertase Pin-like site-specific DNA recombinase